MGINLKKEDRGPNDLERTIARLEARVEELKQDNEILVKEIDRLSEYNRNLETIMKIKYVG